MLSVNDDKGLASDTLTPAQGASHLAAFGLLIIPYLKLPKH